MTNFQGIVLNKIKYAESSTIIRVFTKEEGIVSVLAHGARKKGKNSFVFQSADQITMEATKKPSNDLYTAKTFSIIEPYKAIGIDIPKTMIACFMCEVILNCLSDNHQEKEAFDFLSQQFNELDEIKTKNEINKFHLRFLLKLTQYLGFEIKKNYSSGSIFNIERGEFTNEHQIHDELEIAKTIAVLLEANTQQEPANRKKRNKTLKKILSYYKHHIPGMKTLKSVSVLEQITV